MTKDEITEMRGMLDFGLCLCGMKQDEAKQFTARLDDMAKDMAQNYDVVSGIFDYLTNMTVHEKEILESENVVD